MVKKNHCNDIFYFFGGKENVFRLERNLGF